MQDLFHDLRSGSESFLFEGTRQFQAVRAAFLGIDSLFGGCNDYFQLIRHRIQTHSSVTFQAKDPTGAMCAASFLIGPAISPVDRVD